jgi:hypothetical protein
MFLYFLPKIILRKRRDRLAERLHDINLFSFRQQRQLISAIPKLITGHYFRWVHYCMNLDSIVLSVCIPSEN